MSLKTVHLILCGYYYDLIERGKKTIEYRDNTPYWNKRLLNADRVTFHRGYTNITMTFAIRYITYNHQIKLHLGLKLTPSI